MSLYRFKCSGLSEIPFKATARTFSIRTSELVVAPCARGALSYHPAHRYDAGPLSFESAAPLIAACIFALISGFNDGGNLLASFTSGRVITPPMAAALLLVSLGGPIILGTAVARTIGTNVI